jgi:structural maintenance of chromosome 4
MLDKTSVFQEEIEKKQEELAPWTEKIQAKESAISIAKSEHELLTQKVNAAKIALESLNSQLEEFENSQAEKVFLLVVLNFFLIQFHFIESRV